MVLFSHIAIINLSDILIGLLSWKKHPLEVEHALKYVSDIRQICDRLDTKAYHFNTQFAIHKRYGEKVHTYRRNKNTIWYIIYNLDQHGNVYVQRIISNHNTKSESD
jgi:hypothetical protein